MGRSTADGFYIYGNVSDETVSEVSREALQKLKSGEKNLALSPLCGTNLAVTAVCTGLASLMFMKGRKKRKSSDEISGIIMANLIAVVIAQPLGRAVQKHITTSVEVDDMEVDSVTSTDMGRIKRIKINPSPISISKQQNDSTYLQQNALYLKTLQQELKLLLVLVWLL